MADRRPVDLITGGAGIVGTHLAEALARAGRRVRVLDLKRWPSFPPDTEVVLGDVRDRRVVADAVAGVEHVYHLSTLINHDRVSPALFHSVIVGGGVNVARAAQAAGAKRVVTLTTTEVYGHIPDGPRAEAGPRRPLDEYGRAKVALEDAMFGLAARGAPIAIVRPPVIVGPRFQFSPLPNVFALFRRDLPVPILGGGEFRVQCAHVDDVVSIALAVASKASAVGEAFNVGSHTPLSYRALMESLRHYTGSRSRLVSLPLKPALALMRAANHFTSPFFLEPGQYEITGEDYVLDLGKAARLLGWQPTQSNKQAFFDAYDWHLCMRPYPKPKRLQAAPLRKTAA